MARGLEELVVFTRHRRIPKRPAGAVVLAAITAFAVAAPAASASAQGLFEFLFGSPRRSGPPSSASPFADPNSPFGRPDSGPRYESGPAVAFCVRLCDGRFFPIQRSSGA